LPEENGKSGAFAPATGRFFTRLSPRLSKEIDAEVVQKHRSRGISTVFSTGVEIFGKRPNAHAVGWVRVLFRAGLLEARRQTLTQYEVEQTGQTARQIGFG
jgi:hypothetical protein